MVNLSLTLSEFTRSVPVCEQSANLEMVINLLESSQAETVLVVNSEDRPLGIIRLTRLLIHFGCRSPIVAGSSYPQNSLGDWTPYGMGSWSSKRTGDEVNGELMMFLEPIGILPSQIRLAEVKTYFEANPFLHQGGVYVVVDAEQKVKGLLDERRLWRALLLESNPDSGVQSSVQDFTDFLKLLDQLPIPLMLNTEQGKTLHQNMAWRVQIGNSGEMEIAQGSAFQAGWIENWTTLKPQSYEEFCEKVHYALSQEETLQHWCSLIEGRLTEPRDDAVPEQSSSVVNPTFIQHRFASSPGNANPEQLEHQVWQFVKLPLHLQAELSVLDLPVPEKKLWLILATDITEQRQLCKELAAKNADLVQLNRLKDEFLACISHELKTPLTAVLGLSSLLKDQKLGELNSRQMRYAQLIYQSGRQLMAVVNDILDLTRLETGQLKLTLETVNLRTVCDRAYEQAMQQIQQHHAGSDGEVLGVDFTLQVEENLQFIVADELRLRQMLVHLLENAFKFTPAMGKVGLKVSRWQGWIDFTVWDTGIGIPESAQHLIFQKFQQLESPLTRQFEGTGLGLVLTQRLARAHGGDISFISTVGKGSKFTLLLPPTPPEHHLSGGDNTLNNQLILIVEAVPHYIENLTRILQKFGYRVIIARSGTEALEKARQVQPRAILLNPVLPLLSGWDVLTLLKADPLTQEIPVLVMATRAERRQAKQNGADGFLGLPVQPTALQENLSRLRVQSVCHQRSLTILRLNPQLSHGVSEQNSIFVTEFGLALSQHASGLNYRILEADDLEQASVLAKVWQPDVLLLEGLEGINSVSFLRSLTKYETLVHLPLVTLDTQTTAAANQFSALSVFPCLIPIAEQTITALLQVIQVAAGVEPQPHLLIFGDTVLLHCEETEQNGEFLPAFTQYLQTAGLRSLLAQSWAEVYSQIQQHSVDLLILYLHNEFPSPEWQEGIKELAQMEFKLPILVLDHRSPSGDEALPLEAQLQNLATEVVNYSFQSMADLLTQIHQLLG